jgi:hypothetical protein
MHFTTCRIREFFRAAIMRAVMDTMLMLIQSSSVLEIHVTIVDGTLDSHGCYN